MESYISSVFLFRAFGNKVISVSAGDHHTIIIDRINRILDVISHFLSFTKTNKRYTHAVPISMVNLVLKVYLI